DLRARGLQPARTSLGTATVELERLRRAVRRSDRDASASAFTSAVVTGTVGVDAGYLTAQRLDKCAALFTPPVPATTWWRPPEAGAANGAGAIWGAHTLWQ